MEAKQGFGEHQNGKRFLASNFKGDICQLLGFKSKEGYFEYRA
jgi:hypothetical protein